MRRSQTPSDSPVPADWESERDQRLRQQGLGTAHVASAVVNGAQLHSGERIQPSVTDLVRKGKSPFPISTARSSWPVSRRGLESPRKHLGKSCAVTDLLGEACGFAQVLEEPLVVREHLERVHQVAADEVNAERRVLGGVGQSRQGLDRLLEEGHRRAVCRPGPGVSSRPPEVGHGLLPHFASHRVMGEPLRLLAQATGGVMLHGFDDSGMELPTAIVEEASVGDLVGQGVLERVLEIGKEARLVEELGGLQPGETSAQGVFRSSAIASRRGKGTS